MCKRQETETCDSWSSLLFFMHFACKTNNKTTKFLQVNYILAINFYTSNFTLLLFSLILIDISVKKKTKTLKETIFFYYLPSFSHIFYLRIHTFSAYIFLVLYFFMLTNLLYTCLCSSYVFIIIFHKFLKIRQKLRKFKN